MAQEPNPSLLSSIHRNSSLRSGSVLVKRLNMVEIRFLTHGQTLSDGGNHKGPVSLEGFESRKIARIQYLSRTRSQNARHHLLPNATTKTNLQCKLGHWTLGEPIKGAFASASLNRCSELPSASPCVNDNCPLCAADTSYSCVPVRTLVIVAILGPLQIMSYAKFRHGVFETLRFRRCGVEQTSL